MRIDHRTFRKSKRYIGYAKHRIYFAYFPHEFQCFQCHKRSFRFRTDRHRKHINNNVFPIDPIFFRLTDDFFRDCKTPLCRIRDAVFIDRQCNNDATILLHQWKHLVHRLLFPIDRVDHRLSIVNPHRTFHRFRKHRINLKWKACDTLKFCHHFFHHCHFIDVGKSYIDI